LKMALEDCDSSPEKRQGRKRRAASSTDQENASPFKKQCEEKDKVPFPFPISIENTYVPHIATRVFRSMENFSTENLLKFRSVSKCWKEGVDAHTSLWHRMSLMRAIKDNRMDVVQLVIDNVGYSELISQRGVTPLHLAASKGRKDIFKFISEQVQDKNPTDKDGKTPLHIAAARGYTAICQQILDSSGVEDKNPRDGVGRTPLHAAALFGNTDVFKLIMDLVEDKNPADDRLETPLHDAARNAHYEIIRLIRANVSEKMPLNSKGHAPVVMLQLSHSIE